MSKGEILRSELSPWGPPWGDAEEQDPHPGGCRPWLREGCQGHTTRHQLRAWQHRLLSITPWAQGLWRARAGARPSSEAAQHWHQRSELSSASVTPAGTGWAQSHALMGLQEISQAQLLGAPEGPQPAEVSPICKRLLLFPSLNWTYM